MVDLRCPELADLETRLAGELMPDDDELYGLWMNDKSTWAWITGPEAWFTPDIRIAYAQRSVTLILNINLSGADIEVRKLGPKGEPLELD